MARRKKAISKKPKELKEPKVAKKKLEVKPVDPERVTFVREGNVSGEYIFKEIPGSVTAGSLEEATEKAKETIRRRSDLSFAE